MQVAAAAGDDPAPVAEPPAVNETTGIAESGALSATRGLSSARLKPQATTAGVEGADVDRAVRNEINPEMKEMMKKTVARLNKDPDKKTVAVDTILDYIARERQ